MQHLHFLMISLLLVCFADGCVAVRRHFVEGPDSARAESFERSVLEAVLREARGRGQSGVVEVDDEIVVFRYVGDLLIVLAGSDEQDELSLDSGISRIAALLGRCSKSELLHSKDYGRFVVALDELVFEGLELTTDVSGAEKLAKLRAPS